MNSEGSKNVENGSKTKSSVKNTKQLGKLNSFDTEEQHELREQ